MYYMNLKRSTRKRLSPCNAFGRLLPDGSLEEPTELRLVIRPDGRLEVESEIGREIKKEKLREWMGNQ